MMKRDAAAFAKAVKGGVTSDFKYSEAGRTMSFESMLAGMKQGFAIETRCLRADTTILSVKEKGKTGSAVEQHVMDVLTMGPDKKVHKMSFVGRSDETYRKVNGKWKLASMDMKTIRSSMDGKPMPAGR